MACVQMMVRVTVLFSVGVFFALILNLLQIQRENFTMFSLDVLEQFFTSTWWIPPACGLAADERLGDSLKYKREWSSVMRCVAVFKIDFANNMQLSMSLAAMSIGLWWLFDRSPSGFGLGVGIAVLATLISQLLIYNGIYRYSKADFLFVRSLLPCVFFSGGVTIGNIGRQLAKCDLDKQKTD
ncbi:hypothetical protein KUTeg_008311 [Tegillarca granosa]|uniref:Insulin-induced gene protein n=1 Tax=Tegillarca granosa TaxID=220873 RepID=A0ABQ9FBX6_TEGGR|nr:hypothetical protein KUTeg_008311 [Tegillarca granosa]